MNCPKCQNEARVIPEGISRKTGRAYAAFAVCDNCKWKETPKGIKDPIKAAQERKGQSISEAQTRNETMWGKNNACMIIAHHPAYKNLTKDEVEKEIKLLANKIINLDILPF